MPEEHVCPGALNIGRVDEHNTQGKDRTYPPDGFLKGARSLSCEQERKGCKDRGSHELPASPPVGVPQQQPPEHEQRSANILALTVTRVKNLHGGGTGHGGKGKDSFTSGLA